MFVHSRKHDGYLIRITTTMTVVEAQRILRHLRLLNKHIGTEHSLVLFHREISKRFNEIQIKLDSELKEATK